MDELKKTDCPDCGVVPGLQHEEGCDVARCVLCGFQDLGCGYQSDGLLFCSRTDEPKPAETMQTWTGVWPGIEECQEFGWFFRWTVFYDPESGYVREPLPHEVPNTGDSLPCEYNDPHASEDLNRLVSAGAQGLLRWDRDRQRWVR
jgi:hypothetical protein